MFEDQTSQYVWSSWNNAWRKVKATQSLADISILVTNLVAYQITWSGASVLGMFVRLAVIDYCCWMGWMFLGPPNSYVEILNPTVVVAGGGAFGIWWSPEGGALMNGINDVIKGTPENSSALCHGMVQMRSQQSAAQNRALPWTQPRQHPGLEPPASRTVSDTFLLFISLWYFLIAAWADYDSCQYFCILTMF